MTIERRVSTVVLVISALAVVAGQVVDDDDEREIAALVRMVRSEAGEQDSNIEMQVLPTGATKRIAHTPSSHRSSQNPNPSKSMQTATATHEDSFGHLVSAQHEPDLDGAAAAGTFYDDEDEDEDEERKFSARMVPETSHNLDNDVAAHPRR